MKRPVRRSSSVCFDLRPRVHHERPVAGDGLAERSGRREQEAAPARSGRRFHEVTIAEDDEGRPTDGLALRPELDLAVVEIREDGMPRSHRFRNAAPGGA